MSTVYCHNCTNYELHSTDWGSDEYCNHSSNIVHGHNYNGPTKQYKCKPSVKNQNADCEDYVKIISKCHRIMMFIKYMFGRKK